MYLSTIEKNFKYHAPKEGQPQKYETIRNTAKELAILLRNLCPDSYLNMLENSQIRARICRIFGIFKELTLAMTKLEECVMWANASIARNESSAE